MGCLGITAVSRQQQYDGRGDEFRMSQLKLHSASCAACLADALVTLVRAYRQCGSFDELQFSGRMDDGKADGRNDLTRGTRAGLAPKPARSRLEPFGEFIDEMRKRGRTYREIARVPGEKCGLQAGASTVHYFVRGRRPAKEKRKRVKEAAAVLKVRAPFGSELRP